MSAPKRGLVVLTRRGGERIFIDSDIEITITRARKGIARVSVSAPKHVVIDRPDSRGDEMDRISFKAWLERVDD